MPQDAFTLNTLTKELNSLFSKGKINRINQPDDDKVIFTVFNGKSTEKLLLDVNPGGPRIGVIKQEKENLLTALNFCMLLRKHLLSAEINKIELVGFDRIVKITCTCRADYKDDKQMALYVELMGRYSNIILTENGLVLGANRGINMIYNGVRPLIVGKPYVLPPVNVKKEPNDISLIEDFSYYNGENLPEFITQKIQGVSVSTAREIVEIFAKNHSINPIDFKVFFDFINYFLYGEYAKENNLKPCVVLEENKLKDVCVFSYLTMVGDRLYFDKLYLAEEYYYEQKNYQKEYDDLTVRINAKINTALKKHQKKLNSFLTKEKDCSSMEENRIKGELILSNIYKIKQGDKFVEALNYYDDNKAIIIELDEKLSPSKNSENYYKKYAKQKRSLETLKEFKTQTELEIEYLKSLVVLVQNAENISDLNSVVEELKIANIFSDKNQGKKAKKQDVKPYRTYEYKGYKIKVGKNNVENDELVSTAHGNDLWLHAKDYHSSHVLIERRTPEIPEEIIIFSAEIGAYYSKGRDGEKVEMVYTLKKNVKKPKKSKPGFVTYDKYSSIVVKAEKHAEYLK